MNTKELIESRKSKITKVLRGYDSSLKLSGSNSFIGILNWIDNNTSTLTKTDDELETIKNKLSIVARMASLKAKRTKNSRALDWLNNSGGLNEILGVLREYRALNQSVWSVDEETVNKFNSEHKDEGIYKNIIHEDSDGGSYEHIIRYNNTLYHVLLPTAKRVESNDCEIYLSICICDDNVPLAVYNYVCNIHSLDSKMNPLAETEEIRVVCTNKKCPNYKACLAPAYEDGSKHVDCNVQMCNKCEAFKGEVVSPYKLLEIIKPVVYAFEHRTQSSRVINEGEKIHYEPIPLPESDKEVIVYTDNDCKQEAIIRIIDRDKDYIPGTHASPREHQRKEHYRYNKKTGLKDIKVKGCTVNKGHTKTNYKVTCHKNYIEELLTEH